MFALRLIQSSNLLRSKGGRYPMLIVYRDQDHDWWVEREIDKPIKYGRLENLPDGLADKIVALQHAGVRTGIEGVGTRVGENRYWVVDTPPTTR